MGLSKFFFFLILTFNIFGCVEKTTFSGKILNEENLNFNITNKDELIKKFGLPSYTDDILNKYFYFSEMTKNTNFYNKEISYRYLFIFEIDGSDNIIGTETINLLENQNHKYKNIETNNNIIKRGILETYFGGIGAKQIPNSP